MEHLNKDYYTIGETSKILNVDQHVVRFWTSKFSQHVKPARKAGQRRYYTPKDILTLQTIKKLLYERGISIKGVLLILKENKKQASVDKKMMSEIRSNATEQNINSLDFSQEIKILTTLQNKIKTLLNTTNTD